MSRLTELLWWLRTPRSVRVMQMRCFHHDRGVQGKVVSFIRAEGRDDGQTTWQCSACGKVWRS